MMGSDLKELQSLIDSLDKMIQENENKPKETDNETSSYSLTEDTEQDGIINSIKNVINQ